MQLSLIFNDDSVNGKCYLLSCELSLSPHIELGDEVGSVFPCVSYERVGQSGNNECKLFSCSQRETKPKRSNAAAATKVKATKTSDNWLGSTGSRAQIYLPTGTRMIDMISKVELEARDSRCKPANDCTESESISVLLPS